MVTVAILTARILHTVLEDAQKPESAPMDLSMNLTCFYDARLKLLTGPDVVFLFALLCHLLPWLYANIAFCHL